MESHNSVSFGLIMGAIAGIGVCMFPKTDIDLHSCVPLTVGFMLPPSIVAIMFHKNLNSNNLLTSSVVFTTTINTIVLINQVIKKYYETPKLN